MTLLPTATSVDERSRVAKVAVLPIGSFEQHGTYLPLVTDTVVACSIAERVAAFVSGSLPRLRECSKHSQSIPRATVS